MRSKSVLLYHTAAISSASKSLMCGTSFTSTSEVKDTKRSEDRLLLSDVGEHFFMADRILSFFGVAVSFVVTTANGVAATIMVMVFLFGLACAVAFLGMLLLDL